ncbi:S41 family peptidase [Diplocloster agilis]|uniref:S41 family peptidase n=1 Tax=Diplocloster agilis TaxID=2850323 RepID=A0A949K8V3_9FIRM|nr:S41 family peptidase [Diplocloster agilis]MBU9738742.1 S41 family peptidase [Diplocloster agilis]
MQEKREWNQENVQDKNEELEPEETRLKDPGNNHGVLKGFLGGVLVTLCVLAIVLFVKSLEPKRLGTTPSQTPDHTAAGQQLDTEAIDLKLEKLKSLIDSKYMGDVDEEKLIETLYYGYVAGLGDPYSVYFTKEDYVTMMESTTGIYNGIGILMSQNMKTGVITVLRVFRDSPAEEVGLQRGDILYKVAGQEVTGMDLQSVVSIVKTSNDGVGTVEVEVVREDETEPLKFDVERREVTVSTVEHEMLDDGIGYLLITQFDDLVTQKQFAEAMEDLKNQGMTSLIIDVRDNPGGVLDSVCKTLEQILPAGLIVYTEDKYGNREEISGEGKTPLDIPLAVLVNGNSASAAEIFAGAVKDYGIGTLVGTTTYGKGIVQKIFDLGDDTAVKLTVSKYFTPKGNYIHEVGIKPDVEIDLNDDLKKMAIIPMDQDNQLQKAIEILKGQ